MSNSRRVLLMLAILSALPSTINGQGTTYCRAADSSSQFFITKVTSFAIANGGPEATMRTALQLPAVASSEISLVMDETTCQQAAAAYDAELVRARGDSSQTRQVYLIRVGTRYVVVDPTVLAGEWKTAMVLGSDFAILSTFGI